MPDAPYPLPASERKLRIGSNLDVTRAHAQIGERNAAHFRIIFGRNHNLKSCSQRSIAPDDFGVVLEEGRFVRVGFNARGLIARRPDCSRLFIAQDRCTDPNNPA